MAMYFFLFVQVDTMVRLSPGETRNVCGGMQISWSDDTVTVCNNTDSNWSIYVIVYDASRRPISRGTAKVRRGACGSQRAPAGTVSAEGHFTPTLDDTCCVIA